MRSDDIAHADDAMSPRFGGMVKHHRAEERIRRASIEANKRLDFDATGREHVLATQAYQNFLQRSTSVAFVDSPSLGFKPPL